MGWRSSMSRSSAMPAGFLRPVHKARFAFGAIVAFLLITAVFSVLTYVGEKQRALDSLDQRLELAAATVTSVLPENLHQRAMDERVLSLTDEKGLAAKLGALAEGLDVSYLYTLILDREGQVRFVISSPSPDEIVDVAPYEPSYRVLYEEMQETLVKRMRAQERFVTEYEDRWGEFRSLFQPATEASGTAFYVAADAEIERVQDAALRAALLAAGFLAVVCVVAFPLLLYVFWRWRGDRRDAVARLAYDNLTGLASRQQLELDLQRLEHPRLVVVSILGFEGITEHYGPAVGDMVLQRFGRFLGALRIEGFPGHRSYRVHGEEFALVHDGPGLPDDVDTLFAEFLRQIGDFSYGLPDNTPLRLRVATGVVLDKSIDMLDHGRLAQREAVQKHQALVVYGPQLGTAAGARHDLRELAALRSALDQGRIVPYFQPIFRSDDLSVASYEVLARLVDDGGSVLRYPGVFLPVAHRYHLYYSVIRTILSQTVAWVKRHDTRVNMNLAMFDIEHRPSADYILDSLRKSGVADRFSFELLETDAIADLERVRWFFRALRELGCRVGVDDLGKDYSNFDRLAALEVDFVKLDGLVVQHIEDDADVRGVVGELVAISHRNGVTVTAEHISSRALQDAATALGCDFLQGFHLGGPQAQPHEASS